MTFDPRNFLAGLLLVFLLIIGLAVVAMAVTKRAEFHQTLKDRR